MFCCGGPSPKKKNQSKINNSKATIWILILGITGIVGLIYLTQ